MPVFPLPPLPLLAPRHIYALAALLTLGLLGASSARALGEHMRDRTFYENFSAGCRAQRLTLTSDTGSLSAIPYDLCAGTHRNRQISLRWYRAEGSLSRPAVHLSVQIRRPPVDVEIDNGQARPLFPSSLPAPPWPPPSLLPSAQMLPSLALFDGARARSGPGWEGIARMSMPQNAPFDLLWRTIDRMVDFAESASL